MLMERTKRLISIEELDDSESIFAAPNARRTSIFTKSSWPYPWKQPPAIRDERDRVAALRQFDVLDTPPERVFEVICELATSVLQCPIAGVTFLDTDRQWFKARRGWIEAEIHRDIAFCAHTVACAEPMVVLDASRDPKFALNPLVLGPTGVRFYAGAPITTATGHAIGTVCVYDTRPHDSVDMATLEKLASVALLHLEDRLRAPVATEVHDNTVGVFEGPVLSMTELLRLRDCVPKAECSRCSRCHRGFTLFRHKKHCRACGEVFCSFCALSTRAKQRRGPGVFKIHVCLTCINIGTVLGHFRLCRTVRSSLHGRDDGADGLLTPKELEQIQRLEDKDTLSPTRLMPTSDCIPFDERGCCHVCSRHFNLFRPKHSCRVCGDVVCSHCSMKKLAIVHGSSESEMEPVTVCVECNVTLTNTALRDDAMPLALMSDFEAYNNSRRERNSMKNALDTVKTLLVSADERALSAGRSSLAHKPDELSATVA
ncbi:hypothetical protein SPRG_01390 [Saprolegnia parasitica CBS 223.65]|uniref:FYVE-type domain-containing protein n=1 Tax=Saprolegnia parasitica (strain CBS 223.65) TaxID=695850 RepID=A0A067CTT9_SAPPC|nr:hypothetical protein SPRG_01390 [Saprolegnia parasitica CBS 223.65]KDO34119.1 hypothetical protein SPRG_01390 [Saprolegnia parasitica CBS 223.65]|eukprot:XP_012194997.1 hypothetical protein SPRG_01390 [Saprolegnia parasitica CBS 223.65]